LEGDFEDFVATRCETAKLENKEYLKLERNDTASEEEVQEVAETICYKKGFSDALKLMKCNI